MAPKMTYTNAGRTAADSARRASDHERCATNAIVATRAQAENSRRNMPTKRKAKAAKGNDNSAANPMSIRRIACRFENWSPASAARKTRGKTNGAR